MKGDLRCVEGRLMRHDPQFDDPDLETDRGVCPECDGLGCDKIKNVVVSHIYPPIPVRNFDYCATYDGDEPDDDGNIDQGFGATRHEAIVDLIENHPREAAQ